MGASPVNAPEHAPVAPGQVVLRDHDPSLVDAADVPALGHDEATSMATEELDRFLTALDELSPDDWQLPTACELWNVQGIVAHVVGAAASYARWSEFARQWSPRVQWPYRRAGFATLDAINQIQVDDREGSRPDQLIAELRTVGPRAIATRRRVPAAIRAIRMPMPVLGVVPIGYVTDLVYTRDMWVHRLDLARATDRSMTLTAAHDGRMIALMMHDLALALAPRLGDLAISFDLTDPAGGRFRLGSTDVPAATLRLDALDFAWLAAGRSQAAEMRGLVTVDGDTILAERVLDDVSVPV